MQNASGLPVSRSCSMPGSSPRVSCQQIEVLLSAIILHNLPCSTQETALQGLALYISRF